MFENLSAIMRRPLKSQTNFAPHYEVALSAWRIRSDEIGGGIETFVTAEAMVSAIICDSGDSKQTFAPNRTETGWCYRFDGATLMHSNSLKSFYLDSADRMKCSRLDTGQFVIDSHCGTQCGRLSGVEQLAGRLSGNSWGIIGRLCRRGFIRSANFDLP